MPQQVGDDRAGVEDLLEVVEDEQDLLAGEPLLEDLGRACAAPARRCRSPPRAAMGRGIGSRTVSRATKKMPSGKSSAAFAATWSDRRVLPVPPGPGERHEPVRGEEARRPPPAPARARRTRSAASAGCSDGRRASAAAGTRARSPSATTWYSGCGSRRSLSRWLPEAAQRRPRPGGPRPRGVRTASETTTWPPCATAAIRAARLMSSPTSRRRTPIASPACRPIRTRTSPPCRPWLGGERALGLDRGRERPRRRSSKTTKNESPSVLPARDRRARRTPPAGSPRGARGRAVYAARPRRVEQARRALDVGEQEGERAGGARRPPRSVISARADSVDRRGGASRPRAGSPG